MGQAMGPLFLFLLALLRLWASQALSTCKTIDMELVKRKRIEAIRGQILSKLRLDSPPQVEGGDAALLRLPEEVMSLYNSTRDMVRDMVRQQEAAKPRESPQDEYYAKEVHKFSMLPVKDARYATWEKTSQSTFFLFNASQVRAQISSEALLHRAELRMLPKPGTEQRVELYQHYGNGSWRYLDSRAVGQVPEEWLAFDVTEVVRQWLSGQETLEIFKLRVHCSCEDTCEELIVNIDGFEKKRGDLGTVSSTVQKLPYVLVMSTPLERASHLQSSRRRRALDTDYCFGREGQKAEAAGPCSPMVRSPRRLPPAPCGECGGEKPQTALLHSKRGLGSKEGDSPLGPCGAAGLQAGSCQRSSGTRLSAPHTAPIRSAAMLLVRTCTTNPKRVVWTCTTTLITVVDVSQPNISRLRFVV